MHSWISTAALAAALCSASLGAHASGLDSLRQQASQFGLGGSSSEPSTSSSALGGLLGNSGASAGLLSSLGMPAADSASNAAGLITYCVKNNYLNANKAEQVKAELLGKLGLSPQKKEEPKDQGYLSGLAGMITGISGGILRDVLCNQVPVVFRRELYASVSMIVCLLYLGLQWLQVPQGISTALCFAGGLALRLAAIRFGWRLPVFSYQQRWE